MSQTQDILTYLRSGNTLTRLEGLKLFGTISLNSRISDIRNLLTDTGERIEVEMIKTNSGKTVAEYKLVKNGNLF